MRKAERPHCPLQLDKNEEMIGLLSMIQSSDDHEGLGSFCLARKLTFCVKD